MITQNIPLWVPTHPFSQYTLGRCGKYKFVLLVINLEITIKLFKFDLIVYICVGVKYLSYNKIDLIVYSKQNNNGF